MEERVNHHGIQPRWAYYSPSFVIFALYLHANIYLLDAPSSPRISADMGDMAHDREPPSPLCRQGSLGDNGRPSPRLLRAIWKASICPPNSAIKGVNGFTRRLAYPNHPSLLTHQGPFSSRPVGLLESLDQGPPAGTSRLDIHGSPGPPPSETGTRGMPFPSCRCRGLRLDKRTIETAYLGLIRAGLVSRSTPDCLRQGARGARVRRSLWSGECV